MSRKPFYTKEDLLTCGQGELFGPNNAQLPMPPMLMVDEITFISEKGGDYDNGHIKAVLNVDPSLWFFECHFKDDPVMPGCLGLDAMWQLVGFYLGWLGHPGRGRALGAGEVKFSGEVIPTSKLVTYNISMSRVIARSFTVGVADATMECDGKIIYTAKNLKVGLFKKETLNN